jgi:hypothetical protein
MKGHHFARCKFRANCQREAIENSCPVIITVRAIHRPRKPEVLLAISRTGLIRTFPCLCLENGLPTATITDETPTSVGPSSEDVRAVW